MEDIKKVVTVYHDWDKMEEINRITEMSEFNTDNWCDKATFEAYPELYSYISAKDKALLDKIDFVVFRLDV